MAHTIRLVAMSYAIYYKKHFRKIRRIATQAPRIVTCTTQSGQTIGQGETIELDGGTFVCGSNGRLAWRSKLFYAIS